MGCACLGGEFVFTETIPCSEAPRPQATLKIVTMNLGESYRVLGVGPDTSEEDRFIVYGELREKLQAKRANAPTKGLKANYEEGLKRLDEAIETVESHFDAKELPILGSNASVDRGAKSGREEVSKPKRRSRRKPLWIGFFAVALVSFIILSKLAWDRHVENEKQRLVEIELARAEEVRKADIAAARNKIQPLRAPYADFSEDLESIREAAEGRLEELETADAVAKREGSRQEQEVSALRLERFRVFNVWLQAFLDEHSVAEKLATADRLVEKGNYEEARATLEGDVPQIDRLKGDIESAEWEKYEQPLEEYLAKEEFSRALAESEKALERREYRRAIDALNPYENIQYVKELAQSQLSELYRLKADDVLERAQHATEIGEFPLARSILDSLEDDPVSGEQRKAQLELVEKLNSEYALEEAVNASSRAIEQNAFELARKELAFLVDDPHVGERAQSELEKVDALASEWQEQEAARRRAAEEVALQAREAQPNQEGAPLGPDFDTPPQLLSRIEPLYPDLLRQGNISGFVELEWEIGVNGRASDVNVLSSSRSEFELPAMEAVKRWRFRPAQKDGRPVPAKVRQKLVFNPR